MPYFILQTRSRPSPKAKPEYSSGSIPHMRKHWGDHAGAQNLDPAGILAHPAALAAADRAGDVNLAAGLREGEIAGPQADLGLAAIEFLGKDVQHAAQVRHSDSLVDHQALHLIEDGGVGGVHVVAAVYPARADHADGRLLGEHGAHLDRRGVGAQNDIV